MPSHDECTNSTDTKWSTIKRGAAYSLAAGAAVTSTAATSPDADAAVQYSGPQNYAIAQFTSTDFNLDSDAYYDIRLKNYVFGGNYQGAQLFYAPGQFVGFNAALSYVSALSFGDFIGASTATAGSFNSMAYGNNPNSEFDNVTDAYLGFSFPIAAVNHFAWMRVDIDNVAGTFVVKGLGLRRRSWKANCCRSRP